MTRDELEARLWHWMPRADPSVIDGILADAVAYAIAEGGRTAARRAVLFEATRPHYEQWTWRHSHPRDASGRWQPSPPPPSEESDRKRGAA